MILTDEQIFMLEALRSEGFGQYGEYHGATLDSLVTDGFVKVHEAGEHQEGFIARGTGQMYRAITLTEKGSRWLYLLDHDDRNRSHH